MVLIILACPHDVQKVCVLIHYLRNKVTVRVGRPTEQFGMLGKVRLSLFLPFQFQINSQEGIPKTEVIWIP